MCGELSLLPARPRFPGSGPLWSRGPGGRGALGPGAWPGKGQRREALGRGAALLSGPWEPPAQSQAGGVDGPGRHPVPHAGPPLRAPGWLDFTASPNVSRCELPLDRCGGLGRSRGGFVSYLVSAPRPSLLPASLRDSGPVPAPPPFPHFYFKLSLAFYSYVHQLCQAEAGFRRPDARGANSPLLGGSALVGLGRVSRCPCWGSPRGVCTARRRGAPLNSRGRWGKGQLSLFPNCPWLPWSPKWCLLRDGENQVCPGSPQPLPCRSSGLGR